MNLKRLAVLMLLALSLAACGVGGQEATPTPPATSTPRPSPTPRPTPTEAAPPTEAPAPTEDTSGSTDQPPLEDAYIPAPDNSTPYEKGSDPVVDAAVEAMEQEFENQQQTSGLQLSPLQFYVSDASVDETVDFYNSEMPNYGWGAGQQQDEDFGKVMVFPSENVVNEIALIGILDLSKVEGANLSGQIIFTTVGSLGGGTGSVDTPTAETGGSTGGNTSSAGNDLPVPPGGTEVQEGEDSTVDLLISIMNPALQEAAQGENGTISSPVYYKTSATLKDITDFYRSEMQNLGWSEIEGSSQEQADSAFLLFENGDRGAMIFIFEGASMGMTDNLVLTSYLDL